jgi:hypothetical protein
MGNHPDLVVEAGRFPLVVSAVVESVKMTRVLMDGGNDINILYKDSFKKLNIGSCKLRPSHSTFYRIVLGHQVTPLGTITLSVTFGDQVNYRNEMLSMEVIDFEGPYNAIFGRPCYA